MSIVVRSAGVMPTVHTFSSVFSPQGVDVRLRVVTLGLLAVAIFAVVCKAVHQHCCVIVQSNAEFRSHIPAIFESSVQYVLLGIKAEQPL